MNVLANIFGSACPKGVSNRPFFSIFVVLVCYCLVVSALCVAAC